MTQAAGSMAWVTAFLPATDAVTVMTAVDALAAAAAPEDERPRDARRADALTDVMRGVLDSGHGPYGRLPAEQRRRPHLSLTVSVQALAAAGLPAVVPRRALTQPSTPSSLRTPDDVRTPDGPAEPGAVLGPDGLAASDEPLADGGRGLAELAGYGPIPAGVALDVAVAADWRAVGLDPVSGEARSRSRRAYRPSAALIEVVLGRDVTCTFPGCRTPAQRCDIDHIEPFSPSRPGGGPTEEPNLAALCRHHHRLKTHGGWTPSRDPVTGVTVWRSRTGHSYTRDPVVADPDLDPPRPRARPSVGADDHVDAGADEPGTGPDRVA